MAIATFTPGTLLENACFQNLYNEITEKSEITIPDGLGGVVIQDTTPSADDQDKLWAKTASGFLQRIYKYQDGQWLAQHPIPASDARRVIYTGASGATLDALDGGNSNSVGNADGPFWEIDTDFQFRMPIGVGTLPDSGTALSIGDTGGNDQTTLTEGNIPAHSHTFGVEDDGLATDGLTGRLRVGGGEEIDWQSAAVAAALGETRDTGDGTAFNTIPPYITVYFIKRTARIYYVG